MAEWLIRIIGKQRKDIDLDLVVQAVVALGRQLAEEARRTEAERNDEAASKTTSESNEPERDGTTGAAA